MNESLDLGLNDNFPILFFIFCILVFRPRKKCMLDKRKCSTSFYFSSFEMLICGNETFLFFFLVVSIKKMVKKVTSFLEN